MDLKVQWRRAAYESDLEQFHLVEWTLDSYRLAREVDGHGTCVQSDYLANSVGVVRDQISDGIVLDDLLGLRREWATGEVSTPRPR